MGKAIDKLKQLRNDLVSGQKQIDDATAMGKASMLKVLKAHGLKAEQMLEVDPVQNTGIFTMGGEKYVCQIDKDGVNYGKYQEEQ